MQIHFQLKALHQLVLTAVHEHGLDRDDHLRTGIQLIHQTEGRFEDLLKKVIDDKVYTQPFLRLAIFASRRPRVPDNPTARSIEQAVKLLEVLELLVTSPVYRRQNDDKGESTQVLDHTRVSLTEEGKRVALSIAENRRLILRPPDHEQATVFVACAYGHDEIDDLFDLEIRPACEALGLEPVRVDQTEPSETITDSIFEGIRRSRFLIADLTYARPSVYFEIGVAYGLGIPIVLTCRSDHFRGSHDASRVHFDLEQFKISYWEGDDSGFAWQRSMSPAERLRILQTPR